MNRKIRAFTLVELVVVLVLIGIVIQMGYSMLMFGNNTFNLSTSRGLSQQNVRLAETVLSDELKHIFNLSTSMNDFVTNFYSLKFENGELVKSHYVFNEDTDTVEVSVLTKISGDWKNLSIKNSVPGEIDITVSQGELVGNMESPYNLSFKIFTINNSSLLSNVDVDLVTPGTKIYYQQMYDYMSEQANGMSVDIRDLNDSDVSDDTDDESPIDSFTLNDNATLTLKIDSNDVIQSSNSESKNIDKGDYDFEFSVNGSNLDMEGTSITINSNTVDADNIDQVSNSIRFAGNYKFNKFSTSYTIRVNVKNGVYQKDYYFVFQTNDNK